MGGSQGSPRASFRSPNFVRSAARGQVFAAIWASEELLGGRSALGGCCNAAALTTPSPALATQ